MPFKFSESVRAGRRACVVLLLIALHALRTLFLAPHRGRRLAAAAALLAAMLPQTVLAASPPCDDINTGAYNRTYGSWEAWTVGDPTSEPFAAGETLTYSYENVMGEPRLRLHSASAGTETLVQTDFTTSSGNGSYIIPQGSDYNRFLIGNEYDGSVTWTISCTAAPVVAPSITSASLRLSVFCMYWRLSSSMSSSRPS